MKIRNNRGGIGSLVVLFTATIVIAIILILFVVLAGIFKAVERGGAGEIIYQGEQLGIDDMNNYMKSYNKLIIAEKNIGDGSSVSEALISVEYGKNRAGGRSL